MSLIEDLRNKEFRDAFVEANIGDGIAFQIQALRRSRDWTQAELAKQIGTSPSAVSRLEDPDGGVPTVRTLLRLASAFDVALLVRFAAFSKLLDETRDLSPKALAVPSFSDDSLETSSQWISYDWSVALDAFGSSYLGVTVRYPERELQEPRQYLPTIPPEIAWSSDHREEGI